MNKFSSKNFFNDNFFTDSFVYTFADNSVFTIKAILNTFWENNNGGIKNQSVADWVEIAIQKLDIGFVPKVHETLTKDGIIYNIQAIRDESDVWYLNCQTKKRAVK